MNTIITGIHRFSNSQLASLAAGGALAAFRAGARLIRLRRDRAHLEELPDHMLRDIGISRSEIISITRFDAADPTRRRRG